MLLAVAVVEQEVQIMLVGGQVVAAARAVVLVLRHNFQQQVLRKQEARLVLLAHQEARVLLEGHHRPLVYGGQAAAVVVFCPELVEQAAGLLLHLEVVLAGVLEVEVAVILLEILLRGLLLLVEQAVVLAR